MSLVGGIAKDVGSGAVKILWSDLSLAHNLSVGDARVQNALTAAMEYNAPRCEAHMKTNAPWTDQTGNARNGLSARAFQEGKAHGIVLYHMVPYGIWLEVRWSGKYAIIMPTIEIMGPVVMQSVNRLMDELSFT